VADLHTYAVDWRPGELRFLVDGEEVKRVGQAPDYPVQLQIAVVDFPDRGGPVETPELVVEHVLSR
jgi:hypothetical protein